MHNPLCLHDDHEGSDDDHDHFDEKDDVDDDPRAGPTISSWKQKSFHLSFAKLVSNINFKFNQENSFPYRVQKNL